MWPFAEMRAFARSAGRMTPQPMVSRGRDTGNSFEVRETANQRQPPLYLQRVFAQVDPFELRLLRRFVLYRSRPAALQLALIVNRLGDGWIYPILALVVLAYPGRITIQNEPPA